MLAGRSPRASTRADRFTATVSFQAARAPARQLAQRDLEHVECQRHDQPGLLGDWDELVGRHPPAVSSVQRASASTPVIAPDCALY